MDSRFRGNDGPGAGMKGGWARFIAPLQKTTLVRGAMGGRASAMVTTG